MLLVGRWAIKVPTTRPYGAREDRVSYWCRGVLANKSEREWSGVEGLCPVLHSWLGGIVQVYRRCEPVVREEWLDQDAHARWRAISPMMPANGDRKPENLGMLDGRVVWVDYDVSWNGCPQHRWHDQPEE